VNAKGKRLERRTVEENSIMVAYVVFAQEPALEGCGGGESYTPDKRLDFLLSVTGSKS